jgi:hypothetical protein
LKQKTDVYTQRIVSFREKSTGNIQIGGVAAKCITLSPTTEKKRKSVKPGTVAGRQVFLK